MEPVIDVRHLTKKFKKWDYLPSKELKSKLVNLLKFNKSQVDGSFSYMTVLKDVSFKVMPGEYIGIMGRNGVGKSTILKLISKIYYPTEGTVTVNGRIAPLLELGAGFHGDLSGYENIFFNAAILGYGKKKTKMLVDEIIEFSELGEKIAMPVRNYSNGMLVRLGFSVASHLEAPIILLDEVLGVGDAGFFQKSTQKVLELNRKGSSIVLVTHDPEMLKQYCSRCIVIENQEKVYDGEPLSGTELYSQAVKK